MTTGPEDQGELQERAHEWVEDLPAETALGNRDPEGGGTGEPGDVRPQGGGSSS